jgi:hypothetical protein
MVVRYQSAGLNDSRSILRIDGELAEVMYTVRWKGNRIDI